ncbi:uncharacterized protein SPAPADRAFT_61959 [Spathaspora passalidarum NRRL Y-27907]|uniref:Glutaredoxin-like protein n=1 Tax=Spathaspora passalidarum (strain NRRL Y-27907 / 11-Y1) TaxID=619300 RepID=G3AQ45_SPAPN|nr:uncharacterized protein SPAPADRAFT_61959 [Spathaspora passalidarum NRRL Y-27907]EGW31392.1 hypothetical protein SPAPADRAFT_61959 [Spathaspora passalidarum NRRL Y-27907]
MRVPNQFMYTSKRYFSRSLVNTQVSLTFFTKEKCMLCTNAGEILRKAIVSPDVGDIKINLKTIDIMKPENQEWFDKYCYDVPVLHIDRPDQAKPVKFMHYFDQDVLEDEFKK